MTNIYVQFSDAAGTEIVAYSPSPQDEVTWPNQGSIDTSDARWNSFYTEKVAAGVTGLPPATTTDSETTDAGVADRTTADAVTK